MRKFLPYILIFIILIGLFTPMVQFDTTSGALTIAPESTALAADDFKETIKDGCSIWPSSFSLSGCILYFFYFTYFQLPSFILWISAQFFNAMIALGISSSITSTVSFIPSAWAVVRDLSNMFFILILLYVAIQTILGIGHETKKIIVRVIIMALLINFSMFFTKVVIDSSNILASVFYNKIDTKTKNITGKPREYTASTPGNERDVSGALYKNFNVTTLLDGAALDKLKTTEINGETFKEETLPFALTFGIMVIAGSIMLFAAYTFFVTGFYFLGRLIELWVLIIFSPFAFMSWPIPLLSGTEYIGWSAWSKRLIATSFMAPIFMFFLYLIFKLISSDIFTRFTAGTGAVATILGMIIPALIILALLLKAASFAKKGGGQFGELVMKGAKIAGGLALGAATGGAAMAATGTIGKFASSVANDETLKAKAASGDVKAQRKLALANSFANKSFDLRETGLGKLAVKKSGMDLNAGMGTFGLGTKDLEGGYKAKVKQTAEAEEAKFKTYQLSKSAAIAQDELAKSPSSQKQNVRAKQYEEDKGTAKAAAQTMGFAFNEKQFKEDYEKGGDMSSHGVNKTVEAGSIEKIKTSKEINEERRTAYADSLETKNKEGAKVSVGKFFDDWRKGAQNIATNPSYMAATGAGTVMTGGVALGAALGGAIGGGFLHALKETIKPKIKIDAEVIAGVRRGVKSKKEEALEHLGHAFHEEHEEEQKEGGHGEHHEPEHPPAPAGGATPPPDTHGGGGGGSTHH